MTHPDIVGIITWCLDLLLLQGLNGKHCPISRVTVISSASTIKFSILYDWYSGSEALEPTLERRLFIKMAIEKYSHWQVSFNLGKNKWRETFVLNHL